MTIQDFTELLGINDAHAARILGVSAGCVSNWRSGYPIPEGSQRFMQHLTQLSESDKQRIKDEYK